MSWYFGAGRQDQIVFFSDQDLADIIASQASGDRYGVEQEILKRIKAQRPDEPVFVHVYSLDPLIIGGCYGGGVPDNWWEGGPDA